ncbi:beta-ketoacyl synthase N-terminal-like domain-containing protein [Catelliglobosispora koreensis]|uniref:beta-ketoacyl synthase N-terminal-like domain-containing protein n=1 Tax=Catelliglobosispora koreensis TaxID=129052 RepID=UPI000367D6FE|nr:beta-ketoacyl synthase N-terminal-like domain-containing protein [Catelliglobosispora koreensis]
MSTLFISGFASISSAGMRAGALAERVSSGQAHPGVPVGSLYEAELPAADGHALTDFDVKTHLGRKGTSFYDRATALAVVACGEALANAHIEIDEETRPRIGIALGTTLGSFKSTSDFSMETLVQPKPYLVNPVLFPNTVMNCAAGQAAIRYGLRGANATITGGPMAFLNALRYAGNAINRGYADTMLVGAVEEFTPHRAWMTALSGKVPHPAGEAVAVFAVSTVRMAPVAEVLAIANGYGPGGQGSEALAGCVQRVLRKAHASAGDIRLHAITREAESGALAGTKIFRAAQHFGDCGAATGAIALASVLELHEAEPARDGELTLLTASTDDGAVGAAIIRGWSRGGADRG